MKISEENFLVEEIMEGLEPEAIPEVSAVELLAACRTRHVIPRVCTACGEPFLWHRYSEIKRFERKGVKAPQRCPKCLDLEQHRPSVCVERQEVWCSLPCEVVNLPEKWEEFHTGAPHDLPCWKMVVKGSQFGASWAGRIDLFAPRPIEIGETVLIREREAHHLVKRTLRTKGIGIASGVPGATLTVEDEHPYAEAPEEAEEVLKEHRYLLLHPIEEPAECRMVWATAHTKTTLKGLGRQYGANLNGLPLRKWEISGGVRSGRKHTTAWLAVVDQAHPVFVKGWGDVEIEEEYS